jgi:hypothetical protein
VNCCRALAAVSLVAFLIDSPTSSAAPAIPTSDPQAVKLAAQAIAALTGGVPVADVTLNANVIWIAGSTYLSGTGTLQGKGTSQSRVDLSLEGATRSEIRTSVGGVPKGAWNAGAPGLAPTKLKPFSTHNCLTDADWFYPGLSSLAQTTSPLFVYSYVGQEKHGGVAAEHIRASQVLPLDTKDLVLHRLSVIDFYLDSGSFLPLAIAFKAHPDNDLNRDIPMEIRFANYQAVNGVQIPFHIQRLFNGSLALDVVVTNAVINSGLPDSLFSL